jgi:hypothetical protein
VLHKILGHLEQDWHKGGNLDMQKGMVESLVILPGTVQGGSYQGGDSGLSKLLCSWEGSLRASSRDGASFGKVKGRDQRNMASVAHRMEDQVGNQSRCVGKLIEGVTGGAALFERIHVLGQEGETGEGFNTGTQLL